MWSAVQGACSSLALCTSVISVLCHLILLHFLCTQVLCTQCLQTMEKILFLPTPVGQTAQNLSELCRRSRPVPQIMIFVFHAFTQSFLLHCFLPSQDLPDTFLERFSDDNKVIGIKVLPGDPEQDSRGKASSTMMKSSRLSTQSW